MRARTASAAKRSAADRLEARRERRRPTSCGTPSIQTVALGGLGRVVHAVDEVPGHRRAGGRHADARPTSARPCGARGSRRCRRSTPRASTARGRPPSATVPCARIAALLARPDVGAPVRRHRLDAAVLLEREVDRHVAGAHAHVRERAVRADVDRAGAAVAALAQHAGLAVPHRPPRRAAPGRCARTRRPAAAPGRTRRPSASAFSGRPARSSGIRSGGSGTAGRPSPGLPARGATPASPTRLRPRSGRACPHGIRRHPIAGAVPGQPSRAVSSEES